MLRPIEAGFVLAIVMQVGCSSDDPHEVPDASHEDGAVDGEGEGSTSIGCSSIEGDPCDGGKNAFVVACRCDPDNIDIACCVNGRVRIHGCMDDLYAVDCEGHSPRDMDTGAYVDSATEDGPAGDAPTEAATD